LSDTCPSPAVVERVAGAGSWIRSDAAAPCESEPDVPVMVSETAYGNAADVVCIVSVDVPEPPVMLAGLKLPVTPDGRPFSLPTASETVPVKPASGVTVTVNCAD
jgi:hypothetical protein